MDDKATIYQALLEAELFQADSDDAHEVQEEIRYFCRLRLLEIEGGPIAAIMASKTITELAMMMGGPVLDEPPPKPKGIIRPIALGAAKAPAATPPKSTYRPSPRPRQQAVQSTKQVEEETEEEDPEPPVRKPNKFAHVKPIVDGGIYYTRLPKGAVVDQVFEDNDGLCRKWTIDPMHANEDGTCRYVLRVVQKRSASAPGAIPFPRGADMDAAVHSLAVRSADLISRGRQATEQRPSEVINNTQSAVSGTDSYNPFK